MPTSRVLFWHRRDLRLADNFGLVAAAQISPAVTGVYVLDPAVINPPPELPPMAPARLWFLIESLVELQQRWRETGSRLLVVKGDPVVVLPQLAQQQLQLQLLLPIFLLIVLKAQLLQQQLSLINRL